MAGFFSKVLLVFIVAAYAVNYGDMLLLIKHETTVMFSCCPDNTRAEFPCCINSLAGDLCEMKASIAGNNSRLVGQRKLAYTNCGTPLNVLLIPALKNIVSISHELSFLRFPNSYKHQSESKAFHFIEFDESLDHPPEV